MTPAAILYYFPGAGGGGFGSAQLLAVPEHLRAKFATNTRQDGYSGPDGGRGMVITWQEDVSLSYDRKAYAWRHVDEYWVGIRNGYSPEEFAERVPYGARAVNGHTVPLGDGKLWRLPIARASSPEYSIPWRETLDEEGQLLREIVPSFAAVAHAANVLSQHCAPDSVFTMDDAELRLICAHVLAVNYRLDLPEILLLGLLNWDSYRAIVFAVLDLPALPDGFQDPATVGAGASTASGPSAAASRPPESTPEP